MVTAASTYLFEATERRFFFKNVSILIPDTWEENPQYKRPKHESYTHVRIKESLLKYYIFWCSSIELQIDCFRVFLTKCYHFYFWCFKNLFKHSQADVLIAPPTLPDRDDPYTKQFKPCGEKGEYIHFTPDFVLGKKENEYGPAGKN